MKKKSKKYRVALFKCGNCSESKYVIVLCDHCGEVPEYEKTLNLTAEEIQKMLDDGIEFAGDFKRIQKDVQDTEDTFGIEDESDEVDLSSLKEDDIDDLDFNTPL